MDDQIYQHVQKLYLFAKVAQIRNFRQVADRVGVTPSAISQNITALEAYLQETLLIRNKGNVEVTRAGQRLLDEIQPILANLADLSSATKPEGRLKDRVKFGAYESIALTLGPELFFQLKTINPRLRLDIQTGRSSQLATLVRQGALDFAFVTEGIRESGVTIDSIGSDGLGLYIARHSDWADKGWAAVENLGVGTFSSSSDGYPPYYQKFLSSLPAKFTTKLTTDSIETILSMTRKGLVIGILPHIMANRVGDLQLLALNLVNQHPGTHDWLLVSRHNTATELRGMMLKTTRHAFREFQNSPFRSGLNMKKAPDVSAELFATF